MAGLGSEDGGYSPKKMRNVCVKCAAAGGLLLLVASLKANEGPLRMVERGQAYAVLEWVAPTLRFEPVDAPGKTVYLPRLGDLPLHVGENGLVLPVAGIAVEIPAAAVVSLVVEDSTCVAVTGLYPPVYATVQQEQGPEGISRVSYRFGAPLDVSQNASQLQRAFAEVSDRANVAGHHLVRVALYPLQYEAATGRSRLVKGARVRVQWRPEAGGAEQHPPGDDVQRLIRELEHKPASARSLLGKPSSDDYRWYDPSLPYCKLLLVEEGLYAVRGRDLQDLNLMTGGVRSSSLRLYHRGEEVAIHVADGGDGNFDAEDLLVFPARRRGGDSTYYPAHSDTNVYWLTWGADIGRRLALTPAAPAGQGSMYWFPETLHVELDCQYYSGDSDVDVHNTFVAPGEGWVWHFFRPGDSLAVQVPLRDLAWEGDSLRLTVPLRGTTLDPVNPDHHARLWCNGHLAAEVWFDNRERPVVTATLPAEAFRRQNELAVASAGNTGATIDQFYLDWIELIYPRRPQAIDGTFVGRIPVGSSAQDLAITGFASDSILVVDVGKGALLTDWYPSRTWWGRFAVLSAGYHDGDRAEIWQDDQLLWSGGRGHNLVVIDGHTGQVVSKKHYDTYASQADADSMAAFVERLPAGTLVVVAIRDEGSVAMTPRAYSALESLGSALCRHVGVRDSWALIGRKGASPGSVPEALRPAHSGPVRLTQVISFQEGGAGTSVTITGAGPGTMYVMAAEVNALKRPARIVLDLPSSLRSPRNAADYLLITHPRFAAAAEELAKFRRQHNGMAVSVALIEDVYDEFTYGLAEPEAIRLLVSYATQFWQVSPSFLLLFGDACWDPKGLLAETVKKDYVPTFGNPVSDAWFACLDGPDDMVPDLFVGRIPAETPEQAESIVQKIIAYEQDITPAAWRKRVLLINGGFDSWEQQQFGQQSRLLADSIIARPPSSCLPLVISKTSQGYFQGEHRDDILAALNDGVLWTNFVGHAATGTWDLMLNSADLLELTNRGRLPFVTSMTCHTARFANPHSSCFGEQFLALPQSGAIAFWGTTGWGYLFHDQVVMTQLFRAALRDTVHILGAATTLAKVRLWESLGNSQFTRNTILQYSLLGDPATDLALPLLPDLVVVPSDLSCTPAAPSVEDSLVQVRVRVHNFGLCAPSPVEVELWARSPASGSFRVDSTRFLSAIGWQDSAHFIWHLVGKGGDFELEAVVDPRNAIAEAVETDNRAAIRVSLHAAEVVMLKPFFYEVVAETPTLEVLTPASPVGAPEYVEFELDTTISFSSAQLQRSLPVAPGLFSTKWTPASLAAGRDYFWRARAAYGGRPGPWRNASFRVSPGQAQWKWEQHFPDPLMPALIEGAEQTPAGVQLATRTVALRAESAGYHDGQYARLLVGGVPALAQGRGHNLAVVHPGNGQVVEAMSFDTYEAASESQKMADFIANVAEGMIVLAAIADEGSRSMTEEAYRALESLGSALCRQVGTRDSWSLIGRKGAPPGSVPERMVRSGEGVAVVQDSLLFFAALGTMRSPLIGPASQWHSARWQVVLPHQLTTVTVNVEGYDRTSGNWLTLQRSGGTEGGVDLGGVDAGRFRFLRLAAQFATEDGRWSPTLPGWQLSFAPAPELAARARTLRPSDRVVAGDPVELELEIHNLGYTPTQPMVISWVQAQEGHQVFAIDTVRQALAPDSAVIVRQLWQTARLAGRYTLTATVDPDDQVAEVVEFNNSQSWLVQVEKDSVAPRLELLIDGRPIAQGEFVSAMPEILVRLYDNSGGAITDTVGLRLFLDGQRLWFASGQPAVRLLSPDVGADKQLKATLLLQPTLSKGRHDIEVVVLDLNGNAAHLRTDFQVAQRLELREVVNFPNPFRTTTDFCYVLTAPASQVEIRVYTLAGRLVKTVRDAAGAAGFNRVHWDGRDDDGDLLANGVYLYKIAATAEGSKVAVIGKAVVAR